MRKQIPNLNEMREEWEILEKQLELQLKGSRDEIRILQKNADQLYEQIKSLQKELNMDR